VPDPDVPGASIGSGAAVAAAPAVAVGPAGIRHLVVLDVDSTLI